MEVAKVVDPRDACARQLAAQGWQDARAALHPVEAVESATSSPPSDGSRADPPSAQAGECVESTNALGVRCPSSSGWARGSRQRRPG